MGNQKSQLDNSILSEQSFQVVLDNILLRSVLAGHGVAQNDKTASTQSWTEFERDGEPERSNSDVSICDMHGKEHRLKDLGIERTDIRQGSWLVTNEEKERFETLESARIYFQQKLKDADKQAQDLFDWRIADLENSLQKTIALTRKKFQEKKDFLGQQLYSFQQKIKQLQIDLETVVEEGDPLCEGLQLLKEIELDNYKNDVEKMTKLQASFAELDSIQLPGQESIISHDLQSITRFVAPYESKTFQYTNFEQAESANWTYVDQFRIFVCGGKESDAASLISTICGDTWSKWNMRQARAYHAITWIKGFVMVFGGMYGDKPLDHWELYDVRRDIWDEIEFLPLPSAFNNAVENQGKIYIAGQGLSSIQEFDPSTQKYHSLPIKLNSHSPKRILTVGWFIYIISGTKLYKHSVNANTTISSPFRLEGQWLQGCQVVYERSSYFFNSDDGNLYKLDATTDSVKQFLTLN